MTLIRCLRITNTQEAIHEMNLVGVDPTGVDLMKGKALHYNLKVERISPRTANLLKQEMLSLGGEAALDRRGLDCSSSSVDTLLMGSEKQFEKLLSKLQRYPDLHPIGQSLKEIVENLSKQYYTIRCRTRTFTLGKRTLLMGVLNVTPDSFSNGGLFFDKEKAIARGLEMVEEGADFIDVGGESTRPGSKPLEMEEELRRVIPVIESLSRKIDVPISIDTYKSEVAKRAIEAGAQIINDISGLHLDPSLSEVAARWDVPIVLVHMKGRPETMQLNVHYGSLFSEIIQSLKDSIKTAEAAGIDSDQIIIDPGIGFGKRVEDNLLILRNLQEFKVLGKPLLLGTSRKSFIGKILGADVAERLEGTLSSSVIGVLNGAHIIRCHDVLQVKKAIAIADAVRMVE